MGCSELQEIIRLAGFFRQKSQVKRKWLHGMPLRGTLQEAIFLDFRPISKDKDSVTIS